MSTRRCFSRGDPLRPARPHRRLAVSHEPPPPPPEDGPVTADELRLLLDLDHDALLGSAHPLAMYLEDEPDAAVLRQFEPHLVPELLRTDRYVHALLPEMRANGVLPGTDPDEHIAAQAHRWRALRDSTHAMIFILDEAVIRRAVGDAGVMCDQLEWLHALNSDPQIMIKVVPFRSGLYGRMRESFTILEFAEPHRPPLLFTNGFDDVFVTDDRRLMASYRSSFDTLESLAQLYSSTPLRTGTHSSQEAGDGFDAGR